MPQNKGERKRRPSFKTDHQLRELKPNAENSQELLRIDRALLAWSMYLLEISPTFRATLYHALCDEWTERIRGLLYPADCKGWNDLRERHNVLFNSEVLIGLTHARGEQWPNAESWKPSQDTNQRLTLDRLKDLLSSLIDGSRVLESEQNQGSEPVDLLCWRQSHPRPL